MTTSRSIVTDRTALTLEWDKISCPICMEHPHNAVLLLCSSYQKGCRCYVCDTSYRHSNCLDRLKKLDMECKDHSSYPTITEVNHDQSLTPMPLSQTSNYHGYETAAIAQGGEPSVRTEEIKFTALLSNGLKCPLCRGTVLGLQVPGETRLYLNSKFRNCSLESCKFKGNYLDLRRHARQVHPTVRPTEVEPSRQRAWHRLETRCEYDDVLSAIRSENPNAVVLGDYVIDNGDNMFHSSDNDYSAEGSVWLLPSLMFASRNARSSRTRRDHSFSALHINRSRHHNSSRSQAWTWRNTSRGSLNQDARAQWRWRSSTRSRYGGGGGTRH